MNIKTKKFLFSLFVASQIPIIFFIGGYDFDTRNHIGAICYSLSLVMFIFCRGMLE